MASNLNQPWIPAERIDSLIQLEPAFVILGLAIGSWAIYKVFLKGLSEERHRNLRGLFRNLSMHLLFAMLLLGSYLAIKTYLSDYSPALERINSYVGMLAMISGATVFVKTWKILVFEYLFIGHMKVGVPVLLVNLFTLLLSLAIGGLVLSEIFNIRLAPMLATSAIFSLVLGLALQDTLGNLFAAIALQLDKPYEIGDWVEIQSGPQKWTGQVNEISWRATVLIGLSDESLTVPNRVMAQAEISNFSQKARPLVRSQIFRIPFGTPVPLIKETLARAGASVPSIRKNPPPFALISETTESWMTVKLVYFIDDYGAQWLVADQVLSAATRALGEAKIPLAGPRLEVTRIGA